MGHHHLFLDLRASLQIEKTDLIFLYSCMKEIAGKIAPADSLSLFRTFFSIEKKHPSISQRKGRAIHPFAQASEYVNFKLWTNLNT